MMQLQANKSLAVCLFFILISFTVYFNSLNNSFLLDDNFFIIKNKYIKNISLLPKVFKTDIFYFESRDLSSRVLYYRPLTALSYSLDYLFWNLKPAGYRLTNIILHGLNSFILFSLVSFIFKEKVIALLASAFFCIHPIQTSLVGYITGRGDLLEKFFMLLSLLFSIRYITFQKRVYYAGSLFLFVCALFSREGALLLPFLVIMCAALLGIDKKKAAVFLTPYILISALYLFFRSRFLPCGKFGIIDTFSLKNIFGFILLAQKYAEQLILPAGLRPLFFLDNAFSSFLFIFLSVIIFSYSLIKALIYKERIFIFAVVFYFLCLAPTINLVNHIFYFGSILSEHYVYLASIGMFISISYIIVKTAKPFNKAVKACAAVLFLFYASLTVINNTYYKNEITFFNHILDVDKKHSFVRVNLGVSYLEKGLYELAAKQAKLVLAEEPNCWSAYLLLGNVYKKKQEPDKAILYFKKAVEFNPVGVEAYLSLGATLAASGYTADAERVLTLAMSKIPDSVELMRYLGVFYKNKGEFNKAIAVWQRALDLEPDNRIIINNIEIVNKLLKHKLNNE